MDKTIGRNAFMNVFRVIIAIGVPLFTLPYLIRTIGMEGFGQIKFAQSIVGYMSMFALLGIPAYAVNQGSAIRIDRKATNRFISQLVVVQFITTVMSAMLLVGIVFSLPFFSGYRLLIMVLVLESVVALLTMTWIFQVFESFHKLSYINIVTQLGSLILLVIFIDGPEDMVKYAFLILAVSIVKFLICLYLIKDYFDFPFTFDLESLKIHFKPMLVFFSIAVAYKIYIDSDITIIGIFLSDQAVATYAIGAKMYLVVKQIFSAVIAVFIPRINHLLSGDHNEMSDQLIIRAWQLLMWLLIPCMTGLYMISEDMVILLAGASMPEAVIVLKILVISLFFAVLSNIYANLVLVPSGQVSLVSKSMYLAAILNITLNFILIPKFGIVVAAITTLVSEYAIYSMLLRRSGQKLQLRMEKREILVLIIGPVSIVMTVLLLSKLRMAFILMVGTKIMASVLIYLLVTVIIYQKTILKVIIKKLQSLVNKY